ncbi:YCF48-related protein [Flaviaesturariibacter amylovorans]|uniref:Oxidoreductase n=1 Tax=Flaviaesturariibacter amylovorans TaxID=1084520 RepID=A0ABP8GVW3_9BACT
MRSFLLALLLLTSILSTAQTYADSVTLLTRGTKTSIRGLSAVDNNVVWVSGSNGTVGKSTDGGATWKWITVTGFEKRDFRDIEAFDASRAIIIAVDSPAYILKTIDGGASWKVVYENRTPGMFLDAMEFWNEEAGIVVGDPIGGRLFIARSFDGGSTWKDVPFEYRPQSDSGEAMFASSGTNVRVLDRDEAVIVTGGLRSRVLIRDRHHELPIMQGTESRGANSIAVQDHRTRKGGKRMIVVGGDFFRPANDSAVCFYTSDRGRTWKAPKVPPHGYRSCVEYASKSTLLACGINGVDISTDGGKNWKWINREGYHVCRKAKKGTTVFFAGGGGKVGKLAAN